MTKVHRWSYFGIIAFFAIIIVLALRAPKIEQKNVAKGHKPDFYFQNVKLTELYKDRVNLVVYAETAEIDKVRDLTILRNITSDFFNEKSRVLNLKAPIAKLDGKNTELHLLERPKAKVFIEKKVVLVEGDKFVWQPTKLQLTGEGQIVISSGPVKMKSEGFVASIPPREIKLMGNCHVVIETKGL